MFMKDIKIMETSLDILNLYCVKWHHIMINKVQYAHYRVHEEQGTDLGMALVLGVPGNYSMAFDDTTKQGRLVC